MSTKTRKKNTSREKGESSKNELHKAFLDELADMLHAEQQLTKALPKLAKAARSEELQTALEAHLEETVEHISRLEQAFETLEEKPKSKPCKGMKGIISEGDEMVKEMKGTAAIDAIVIAAGQKTEHYEIASYGTLVAWAQQLGHTQAAKFFKQNLQEEKAADEKLTKIALSVANQQAAES
jgi:ferritin-like metal-binding protein YciE